MRIWSLWTVLLFGFSGTAVFVPGAAALPPFGSPSLLADLLPGEAGSGPRRFHPLGDGAIFLADDGAGLRPWWSDGTAPGTFPVGPPGLDAFPLLYPSGPLYWFFGSLDGGPHGLWRTDGTVSGTFPVAEELTLVRAVEPQAPLFDPATGLYFFDGIPPGGGSDADAWVSDGTAAGTRLLVDLLPGADGVGSEPFALFGGRVYFLGASGQGGGVALWSTDGTPEGTGIVATPGLDESFSVLVATPARLFLTAGEGGGDATLWTSDGTADGTVPVRSFGRSFEGGLTPALFPFGDFEDGRTLWRVDTSTAFPALWASDGSAAGTLRVTDVELGGFVVGGTLYHEAVYFLRFSQGHGYELWRTDGTVEGTTLAVEACPGSCNGFALGPALVVADRLILAGTGPSGVEPYVSDGTPEGSGSLGDLCPGPCWAIDGGWLDLGGAAAFTAVVEPSFAIGVGRRQVFVTDLTAEGTHRISDLEAGTGQELAVAGVHLLFSGRDGAIGAEPWTISIPVLDSLPPPGPWARDPAVEGFEIKVRIATGGKARDGALESACLPETACFSGAVAGRSEVFVRVVGPRPNGFLWPTLVKFTTSEVEVWIRQLATGKVRYYRLPGARPGMDELPGLFDRQGFEPVAH